MTNQIISQRKKSFFFLLSSFFFLVTMFIACREEASVTSTSKSYLTASAIAVNKTAKEVGELHNNLLAFNKSHSAPINESDFLFTMANIY